MPIASAALRPASISDATAARLSANFEAVFGRGIFVLGGEVEEFARSADLDQR